MDKTSIRLQWDRRGRISHHISGYSLPPPKDDKLLWALAPSAPLLLAHQFGSMKPSCGLTTCGRVIDVLFHDKCVLIPIDSALKHARIDLLYTPHAKVQFHPRQKLFAASENVEEGVSQLLSNYTLYVYSKLDEYNQIGFKTCALAAVRLYFDFLGEQLAVHSIDRGRDRWSPAFSVFAAQLVDTLAQMYYVVPPTYKDEEWARKQTTHLQEQQAVAEGQRESLLSSMGLR